MEDTDEPTLRTLQSYINDDSKPENKDVIVMPIKLCAMIIHENIVTNIEVEEEAPPSQPPLNRSSSYENETIDK